VGPGHWFERPDSYMRIGYGWPTRDRLAEGLENVSAAIRRALR
jgi:DNA-binding transcriptional MocR family regulator